MRPAEQTSQERETFAMQGRGHVFVGQIPALLQASPNKRREAQPWAIQQEKLHTGQTTIMSISFQQMLCQKKEVWQSCLCYCLPQKIGQEDQVTDGHACRCQIGSQIIEQGDGAARLAWSTASVASQRRRHSPKDLHKALRKALTVACGRNGRCRQRKCA